MYYRIVAGCVLSYRSGTCIDCSINCSTLAVYGVFAGCGIHSAGGGHVGWLGEV